MCYLCLRRCQRPHCQFSARLCKLHASSRDLKINYGSEPKRRTKKGSHSKQWDNLSLPLSLIGDLIFIILNVRDSCQSIHGIFIAVSRLMIYCDECFIGAQWDLFYRIRFSASVCSIALEDEHDGTLFSVHSILLLFSYWNCAADRNLIHIQWILNFSEPLVYGLITIDMSTERTKMHFKVEQCPSLLTSIPQNLYLTVSIHIVLPNSVEFRKIFCGM